jgi:uncharacterized protein (DUF1697 family)
MKMTTYLILLRGINVGGKNKMAMAELKKCFEELGFENVRTFIQSGNVILQSKLSAKTIAEKIEDALPRTFKLDSSLIRVLVLSEKEFLEIIKDKPEGFGAHPEKYHSDVIFLMGISVDDAMEVFNPREGVDEIWPGKDVIYSQRLSSQRTKSRLGKIIGTKPYRSMTIRSWSTVTKLQKLLAELS